MFGEMHRAGTIELHHIEFFIEVSLPEEATHANAGVEARDIERTPEIENVLPKVIDAFARSKVSGDLGDVNTEGLKVCCSIIEARAGGTDDEVISASCQFFCEGKANTARGSGDECKHICHFYGSASGLRASYKPLRCTSGVSRYPRSGNGFPPAKTHS